MEGEAAPEFEHVFVPDQVLSEAFISTAKAYPNAYLLPHLSLIETSAGEAAIAAGTAVIPLNKKNLGHKKKLLIFFVLL